MLKKVDHPELDALLKQVEGYVMTKEEKEAQRQSWFIAELRMLHPEMGREEAIERYKVASGGNVLEDKEVHAINLQLVGALEAIAQIQREKCESADAETLFMVLDNKIDIANAALSGVGVEKYRELLDALDNSFKMYAVAHSGGPMGSPSVSVNPSAWRRLSAAWAALQSGETTIKKGE